jgi:hypothetical protein
MSRTQTKRPSIEPGHFDNQHLLCWKSVLAGVLISFMTFMGLAALGTGVLGTVVQTAIETDKSDSIMASGSCLWLGLSAVVSLFLGSYFTVRISRSLTSKVGAAHGFVVASIFFILLMIGTGNAVGILSRGLAEVTFNLTQSGSNVVLSPLVPDARVVADAGYALALTFFVGLLGALFGGRVGAQANNERPLSVEEKERVATPYRPSTLASERGSALPYLLAWLLGVPTSILFMIFILRSVF